MWPFRRKSNSKNADDLWRQGSRLLRKGKTRQALNVLLRAFDQEPSRLDGRLDIGVAYYMLGEYSKAISHLKYVLAIDNDHLMALLNLGACYDALGELDKSIECLENLCKTRPNYPDAHYNLAVAYMKKRLVEKAESALREELRLRPENQLARKALNELYVKYPRTEPPKQMT